MSRRQEKNAMREMIREFVVKTPFIVDKTDFSKSRFDILPRIGGSMTQKQALSAIRKHVASCGGDPKLIGIKQFKCRPWKWTKPAHWKDKTCTERFHPLDCPTEKTVCRVELFTPVKEFSVFGLPGFIEIVAEKGNWEDAIEIVQKRQFWN